MTLIVFIAIVAFVLWYYFAYNSLVGSRNAVEQAWSNVEVELKRRYDLIQNLVSIVKGYAVHERETLEKVTALRAKADTATDPVQAAAAQQEMAQALVRLVAVAESYPDLKADRQFLNLQQELSGTENRIAERRSAYNQCVNLYQNACESFPGNIIASVHSFPEKAFFDAPDDIVEAAPTISLQ